MLGCLTFVLLLAVVVTLAAEAKSGRHEANPAFVVVAMLLMLSLLGMLAASGNALASEDAGMRDRLAAVVAINAASAACDLVVFTVLVVETAGMRSEERGVVVLAGRGSAVEEAEDGAA